MGIYGAQAVPDFGIECHGNRGCVTPDARRDVAR
jgi:hypothetical protein